MWVKMIAHEHSHRKDYDNAGTIPFLINYLSEYSDNKNKKMSNFDAYHNIRTEANAYKNGDLVVRFFSNPKNGEEFYKIINSRMSDREKAEKLRILALEKLEIYNSIFIKQPINNENKCRFPSYYFCIFLKLRYSQARRV